MAKIFISYRRRDTGQIVASIYNYVAEAFGPESVFIDTRDIPDGQYFTLVIDNNIRDASVMLVVIGKSWLATEADGHRRIDEPGDLVHAEVKLGLELARQGRLTVIPILVDDAPMPPSQQLPPDLSDLHWLNAAQVHSSLVYLTDDINRVLDDISRAGIARRVGGRIEQPPDRFSLLGVQMVGLDSPAQPEPRPAQPASSAPTVGSAPAAPAASSIPPVASAARATSGAPVAARAPSVAVKPVARSSSAKMSGLEVALALLLELPGLIKGILVIGVIIVVIVAVTNLNNGGLTEHSSCQQFEQADSDAQNKVLQQMMAAHNDPSSNIGETRFSLTLYCNVMGPSAPIDGIYNG